MQDRDVAPSQKAKVRDRTALVSLMHAAMRLRAVLSAAAFRKSQFRDLRPRQYWVNKTTVRRPTSCIEPRYTPGIGGNRVGNQLRKPRRFGTIGHGGGVDMTVDFYAREICAIRLMSSPNR